MYTFNQLFKKHFQITYLYKNYLTVGDNNKSFHFNNLDIDDLINQKDFNTIGVIFNLQGDTRVSGYSSHELRLGGVNLMSGISQCFRKDGSPYFTKWTLTPLLCKYLNFSITQCTIWELYPLNSDPILICPIVDGSQIIALDDRIIFEDSFGKTIEVIPDSLIIKREKKASHYGYNEKIFREDGLYLYENIYEDSTYNSIKRLFTYSPEEEYYESFKDKLWKPLMRPKIWNKPYGWRAYLPTISFINIILLFFGTYLYALSHIND